MNTIKCLAIIFPMFLFWSFFGCGGGGGSGNGVTPTVSLKLVRLDSAKLDLTARPIPLRVAIEATFSVAMNTASVEIAVSLVDGGGVAVPGTFSWNADNTVVTFTPLINLNYKTTYNVRISADAVSASVVKGPIQPVDQSFETMVNGDVNGDGYADVIVGSHTMDVGGIVWAGAAYLFSGNGLSGDKAADTALATINGTTAQEFVGGSVAIAGDVNADGYADVVVGAHGVNTLVGAAYVFSGKDFAGIVDSSAAIAVLNGTAPNGFFGSAVSGAGDVNNDGYADVIIGANNADAGIGAAYVFSGKNLSGTLDTTSTLATVNGTSPNGSLGTSVSGIGDINGDHFDDVIIGADQANGTTGSVYIFNGETLSGNKTANEAVATINGLAAGDKFGDSVSGTGDVNGDGRVDLIVGAAGVTVGANAFAGAAYLFGADTLEGTKDAGAAFATLNGSSANDFLGRSVSGAGDVNNDNYNDVIVGAWGVDVGGNNDAGAAYIFSGNGLTGVKNTTAALATVNGLFAGDSLGSALSGAGDVNADGFDDVIIGAFSADIGGIANVGGAYIFGGADLQGVKGANEATATMIGPQSGDWFGRAVGGAAD